MTLWIHELRLLLRARLSVVALILLAILTAAAVTAGMVEISRQRSPKISRPLPTMSIGPRTRAVRAITASTQPGTHRPP